MSLTSHNAVQIYPFRISANGPERRRLPRFEAMGPGELRSTTGEVLGAFRLVDESDAGLGCVSPVTVEIGQTVEVRIGASASWRPAVVVTSTPCGSLKRVGVMFPATAVQKAA